MPSCSTWPVLHAPGPSGALAGRWATSYSVSATWTENCCRLMDLRRVRMAACRLCSARFRVQSAPQVSAGWGGPVTRSPRERPLPRGVSSVGRCAGRASAWSAFSRRPGPRHHGRVPLPDGATEAPRGTPRSRPPAGLRRSPAPAAALHRLPGTAPRRLLPAAQTPSRRPLVLGTRPAPKAARGPAPARPASLGPGAPTLTTNPAFRPPCRPHCFPTVPLPPTSAPLPSLFPLPEGRSLPPRLFGEL